MVFFFILVFELIEAFFAMLAMVVWKFAGPET